MTHLGVPHEGDAHSTVQTRQSLSLPSKPNPRPTSREWGPRAGLCSPTEARAALGQGVQVGGWGPRSLGTLPQAFTHIPVIALGESSSGGGVLTPGADKLEFRQIRRVAVCITVGVPKERSVHTCTAFFTQF